MLLAYSNWQLLQNFLEEMQLEIISPNLFSHALIDDYGSRYTIMDGLYLKFCSTPDHA
jgi:hypothetical protein